MTDETTVEADTILIKITEGNVEWESELEFVEVVFWLEALKKMMLDRFTSG